MRRALLLTAFFGGLCAYPVQASLLTPGGVCKESGFGKGAPLHDECLSRVFRERRSFFWRDQAPYLMMGVVAGIAAGGGSAVAVMSQRAEPGVYRVEVDGEGFLLRITDNGQATVRSATKYKNVRKDDVPIWRRAAEVGTGCSVFRLIRDMDALYLWLDCGVRSTDQTASSAALQSKTPTAAVSLSATGSSLADEVEKLADLRRRGLLTDSEFEAAKAKVLRQ